jgi:hypothetical protein
MLVQAVECEIKCTSNLILSVKLLPVCMLS